MLARSVTLITVIVLAFGLSASNGGAAKRPQRVVHTEYSVPHAGIPNLAWTTPAVGFCEVPRTACQRITPRPGERFMAIDARDASGLPVYVEVEVTVSGPGLHTALTFQKLCGSSPDWISLPSQGDVIVLLPAAPDPTVCPTAATTGTITTTISRWR